MDVDLHRSTPPTIMEADQGVWKTAVLSRNHPVHFVFRKAEKPSCASMVLGFEAVGRKLSKKRNVWLIR